MTQNSKYHHKHRPSYSHSHSHSLASAGNEKKDENLNDIDDKNDDEKQDSENKNINVESSIKDEMLFFNTTDLNGNIPNSKKKGNIINYNNFDSFMPQRLNFFGGFVDDRMLVIRERIVHRASTYKGYETGGTAASVCGFIISAIIASARIVDYFNDGDDDNDGTVDADDNNDLTDAHDNYNGTDASGIDNDNSSFGEDLGTVVAWIIFVVFFTFILFLLGCILEIELRKAKVLYPLGGSDEKTIWFPISQIVNWNFKASTFHAAIYKEKQKGCCQKFACRWFKILFGTVVFVLQLIWRFVMLLVVNAAFGLWIIVTFSMIITYYVHLDKEV